MIIDKKDKEVEMMTEKFKEASNWCFIQKRNSRKPADKI